MCLLRLIRLALVAVIVGGVVFGILKLTNTV